MREAPRRDIPGGNRAFFVVDRCCPAEYGTVNCVVGAECGVILCFYYLTDACVEVCKFAFAIVVVRMYV